MYYNVKDLGFQGLRDSVGFRDLGIGGGYRWEWDERNRRNRGLFSYYIYSMGLMGIRGERV